MTDPPLSACQLLLLYTHSPFVPGALNQTRPINKLHKRPRHQTVRLMAIPSIQIIYGRVTWPRLFRQTCGVRDNTWSTRKRYGQWCVSSTFISAANKTITKEKQRWDKTLRNTHFPSVQSGLVTPRWHSFIIYTFFIFIKMHLRLFPWLIIDDDLLTIRHPLAIAPYEKIWWWSNVISTTHNAHIQTHIETTLHAVMPSHK